MTGMALLLSADCDRATWRARRPLERHRDEDVGELPDAVPSQLAQIEVFVIEDSVLRQELLVDGPTQIGIGIGLYLRRPRVGTDACDLAVGEPSCDLEADPRLAAVEPRVVLHPETSPPGVEEDDVASADVGDPLLGHRPADVGQRDLLALVQHPAL